MTEFEERMELVKQRIGKIELSPMDRLDLASDVLKSAIRIKSWSLAEEAFVVMREALLDIPTEPQ